MDVRRGLVPGAERAGGDVLLDGFGRCAEPGVFPVVDRAGAVGRQVRQPAAGHHSLEDPRGAVAQQVGAVDQDDGGAALAGGADLLRAVVDDGGEMLGAGGRGRVGSTRISSARVRLWRLASGRTFSLARSSGSGITRGFLQRPSR